MLVLRRLLPSLLLGGLLLLAISHARVARADGSYPRTVTFADGQSIVIPRQPQRIVSATLVSDHILLALVGPERLAAVTRYAADPSNSFVSDLVRRFPPTRQLWQTEGATELLLTWGPDLVILASYSDPATIAQLRDTGIPVLVLTHFRSLEDVRANIRTLGRAVGEEQKAERLVAEMDRRLAAVARRVAGRPKVQVASYTVIAGRPFIEGAATSFDAAIRAAGGENVAVTAAGYQGPVTLSMERLLILDPEVILVPGDGEESPDRRFLLSRPGVGGLRAVRSGRVLAVPSRYFHTISHHIAESVERFARLIHPEAFAGEEAP